MRQGLPLLAKETKKRATNTKLDFSPLKYYVNHQPLIQNTTKIWLRAPAPQPRQRGIFGNGPWIPNLGLYTVERPQPYKNPCHTTRPNHFNETFLGCDDSVMEFSAADAEQDAHNKIVEASSEFPIVLSPSFGFKSWLVLFIAHIVDVVG